MVFKRSLMSHFYIFVTYAAQITMEKIVIAHSVAETVPTCKRICLKLEILSTSLRDFLPASRTEWYSFSRLSGIRRCSEREGTRKKAIQSPNQFPVFESNDNM